MALIAMKLSAGGPKDLGDVEGVLDVSGETVDLPLLKRPTRLYGAAEARTLDDLLAKRGRWPESRGGGKPPSTT